MSEGDRHTGDAYDDDGPYDDEAYGGTRDEEAYGETYDGQTYAEDEDDGGTWLDEGAIGLLLLVGIALFLFPEPGTSLLGIVLIGIGVVAWVVDWLS